MNRSEIELIDIIFADATAILRGPEGGGLSYRMQMTS